jgi:methyl-accepting chemotaxis protein
MGAKRLDILRTVLSRALLLRSVLVSIVVGTILNLINQGDTLLGGGHPDVVKLLLTFLVPFCVSIYGAYCAVAALLSQTGR